MAQSFDFYDELCLTVYTTNRYFHRLYQLVLDPVDLTYLQYMTILTVFQHSGCTLTDICLTLDLDTNTLTPVVTKCVTKGWLTKIPSKSDRRKSELFLQPEAKNTFLRLLKQVNLLELRLVTPDPEKLSQQLQQQHQLNERLQHLIIELEGEQK